MGVNRHIYKDGEHIATLWPSYHFSNIADEEEITNFKLYVASTMSWKTSGSGRWQRVRHFNDMMDDFIEKVKMAGANKLIEYMLQEDEIKVIDE
jgi:hypothetical protein